jgi:DNA-binding MurR/RpiR family transcriptional regulator
MSTQRRAAARLLDRPRVVALLSMPAPARQAGVQSATMNSFAKHFGMEGYNRVREVCAAAVRDGDVGFAGKADAHVASQGLKGEPTAQILSSIARQILDDGITGTGADTFAKAKRQDLRVVTSVLPYTRLAIQRAEYAARGIPVVAVTDSKVAPIAQIAEHVIVVPIDSPSFFHATSPAVVAAEGLGRGKDALAARRPTDEHLAALDPPQIAICQASRDEKLTART